MPGPSDGATGRRDQALQDGRRLRRGVACGGFRWWGVGEVVLGTQPEEEGTTVVTVRGLVEDSSDSSDEYQSNSCWQVWHGVAR